jgi:hypothetical protein
MFQMIDQRPLASRGKMIPPLDQADFAAGVVIFNADEFASFSFFDGHGRDDGNTHAR